MMEFIYRLNTRSGFRTVETNCPDSYFKPLLDCVERLPDGDIDMLFLLVKGLGYNIELFEPNIAIEYSVRFK